MYEEVVGEILESLDESLITASYPKFSGEGYSPCRIEAKNFHEIEKTSQNKKIAFVDGGNAEILGSASFSLNLIRVCCVVFCRNKKTSIKKFDILAVIHSISKNNEISYKASFFGADAIGLNGMSFSSFDHTLMFGINRAEISSVANAIRRFAELKLAKIISSEKLADIILLDGDLQSTLTNESLHLNELYESCTRNDVILASLSKTNSVFADNGSLLSAVLQNISKPASWFYHPVVEINNANHKAEMFFAKFHEKSRHVFRFEVFKEQKSMAEEAINAVAGNCIDPIFIGYPYGLVEADKFARVSNHEKESLKTMFLVRLKNKNIEKYLNSANAHEILDKISF